MTHSNKVEVLLVEDNADDAEMTIRTLRKAKVASSIHHALDGAEALDFIFCRGAHTERKIEDGPRVIFLDLKLPKVDGMEVLQQVKNDPRTRSIPVVLLTSSKEQQDVIKGYNLGVNSYIVKPVNFERFAESVKELGMYWLLLNQSPKAG